MSLRFFLIEDDAVVRKMLEKIIHENGLGEVIGQAEDGLDVSADQLFSVDVVLIDLLMPGRDGIQTIKKLREEGFTGQFVMISQVENKEMIGQAYLHGVDTYIQKPINRYEVVSVLKRVAEHISVLQSLQSIRQVLEVLDRSKTSPSLLSPNEQTNLEQQAQQLLLLLGIAGETQGQTIHELPPLKELYTELIQQAHHTTEIAKEVRALEQRIRRLVLQAFTHLASLGLTDYTNPTFEHFAPRLFDFAEIRKRMKELENGEKATKCRINVRKFLTAFYMEMKKAQFS
jgi:two-component system response regulator YcbB